MEKLPEKSYDDHIQEVIFQTAPKGVIHTNYPSDALEKHFIYKAKMERKNCEIFDAQILDCRENPS